MNKALKYMVLFAVGIFLGLGFELAKADPATELEAELEAVLESFDEDRCPAGGMICEADEMLVKTEPVDKAPAPFKDSAIKRKLKDGTMQEFDGDKYKIVRRTKKTKIKKERPPVTTIVVEKPVHFKNRISVLAGFGALGNLKENDNAFLRGFETEQGLVMGLQYQRDLRIREDYSLHGGVQVQTNKTLSIMGGVGF